MATSLNLAVSAAILGYYRGANDIANPEQDFATSKQIRLTTGTNAGQADLVFSDTRTLAASSSENLDLSGVLVDAFGQTLANVEIVAVLIAASAANTNDVQVGGAASNGWVGFFGDVTDKLVVKPGGFALIAAPTNPAYAVVAATGDLLKVANGGAGSSVDYDVIIIGRSA